MGNKVWGKCFNGATGTKQKLRHKNEEETEQRNETHSRLTARGRCAVGCQGRFEPSNEIYHRVANGNGFFAAGTEQLLGTRVLLEVKETETIITVPQCVKR